MALSSCISLSNQTSPFNIDETGTHGTPEFPIAIYEDDVTEGSVLLESGNRKYTLQKNDLFFVNSNVLHAMNNINKRETAVFKSIAFDSSIISNNPESVFYKNYVYPILHNVNFRDYIWKPEDESYETLFSLIKDSFHLVLEERPDYEIFVRNNLSELFSVLIHMTENTAISDGNRNLISEDRVQIILNYIHKNYAGNITLEDLSLAANVSKSEVLRSFKAILHISPIKYLKNFRLQSAAYMLKQSTQSIQTIYERCGFESNSYFSKSFKELYHVSPREYRELS